MDDADLKKLFDSVHIAAPDSEARKATLNLAVAEFKKNTKTFQGSGFFARLISRHPNKENKTMAFSQRKAVYGGLATACVALMVYAVYPLVESNRAARSAIDANKVNAITYDESSQTNSVAGPQNRSSFSSIGPMTATKNQMQGRSATKAMKPASPMPVAPQAELMAQPDMAVSAVPQTRSVPGIMPPVIPEPAPYAPQNFGQDKFSHVEQNAIQQVANAPVSTFSIDVDTASYAFARQSLENGALPQADAVRVEEMVNYFDYAYPVPEDKSAPFRGNVVVKNSPWNVNRKLVVIGIKGFEEQAAQPDSNLVFLVDTSGSMNEPKKLPLLVQSLTLLLDQLKPTDKVSIVAYAGSAGVVLPPTNASDKGAIAAALANLQAGGSTAGGAGIDMAYSLAQANFKKDAVNRVILATDGDFNVGITDPNELKSYIERKRDSGIFLSVIGFGTGNYNDALMQELAQNGNGVAGYIDNLNEARKLLVEEAASTLFPIAKDVKIQVEFNPKAVSEYRLVGYETRALKTEDFNNDKIDAGDIGSGHEVTAIYEITPFGAPKAIDDSRYNPVAVADKDTTPADEYGFLKIRYKLPKETKSRLIEMPISTSSETSAPLASETDFAVAVAGFAQMLKGGQYTGALTYDDVIKAAKDAGGADPYGLRNEFVNLVYKAKAASAMPVAPRERPGYPPQWTQ